MTNIPKSLRESLEKCQAIPFVGAGVSMYAGSQPSGWEPLLWKLLLPEAGAGRYVLKGRLPKLELGNVQKWKPCNEPTPHQRVS
jgi:hypothetical protein